MLRIFVLIAGVLLSLRALEPVFRLGLKQNRNLKMADVALNAKNARLLIHGPCEPLWMISPALLDPLTGMRSYNLSLSHSDFADNYLHLYWYLLHNKPPEFLWLYVTPESFDPRFNTFNAYRFAAYMEDSLIGEVVKDCDPAYYRASRLPLLQYTYYGRNVLFDVVQGYKHFMTARREAYYPDGFEPPARRVWGNHNGQFVELYDQYIHFYWDPKREAYFRKLILLAKQYGIRIFLYESPVLAEALPFQPNRDSILGLIRGIAQEYSLPFVQFDALEMARHREYFVSTLNFNMKGVRVFNDTFARKVRSMCLGGIGSSQR